jgi:hypothetical protein
LKIPRGEIKDGERVVADEPDGELVFTPQPQVEQSRVVLLLRASAHTTKCGYKGSRRRSPTCTPIYPLLSWRSAKTQWIFG